jgi:membrane-associated phospholipid phosphatase
LPAVTLTARLIGIVVLGVVFIALTIAVTAGAFGGLDLEVARAMHDAWQPSLHGLFQGVAELGGLELTTVLMIGLTYYLWRSGFGSDALVFVVFIAAQAFELFYKLNLQHVQPPRSLAQTDGPSITESFTSTAGVGNSFPSGHVLRAVIVYGLIAFVIGRLSPSPRVRLAAVLGAIGLIVVVAFDRLYLDVHWESDVVGGLILGAIALLAGTVWLDRPTQTKAGQ